MHHSDQQQRTCKILAYFSLFFCYKFRDTKVKEKNEVWFQISSLTQKSSSAYHCHTLHAPWFSVGNQVSSTQPVMRTAENSRAVGEAISRSFQSHGPSPRIIFYWPVVHCLTLSSASHHPFWLKQILWETASGEGVVFPCHDAD